MHTEQKNSKKLKELYGRALAVKSAIPHPRIMGVIRECGGKMHMHERAWSDAATDFFEVRLVWRPLLAVHWPDAATNFFEVCGRAPLLLQALLTVHFHGPSEWASSYSVGMPLACRMGWMGQRHRHVRRSERHWESVAR